MKEEDIIKKCGKTNPFTVPEGYFENFTQQMMEQLPDKQTIDVPEIEVTLWQRVKPLLYLAAVFVGLMVCIRFVVGDMHNEENKLSTPLLSNEQISDQDIETIVEYSMMDNYTLYRYLTDAE